MAGTNGEYNKINAAHVFGGADMQIKTVENVLHIPINHYFSIDMDAMKDLGDAVGGVTVDNAFAFDAEGIHYPKGKQHLGAGKLYNMHALRRPRRRLWSSTPPTRSFNRINQQDTFF